MKTTLMMVVFLIGMVYAQPQMNIFANGIILSDSLGYSGSDAGDSTWILKLDFNYDWLRVFIEGNADSPVDSIGIRFGTIRYSPYGSGSQPADTLWGSYFATIKDSAYNNCTRIINNTLGKDYFLLAPAVQLVKFEIMNYRAASLTREVKLTVQAIKPSN